MMKAVAAIIAAISLGFGTVSDASGQSVEETNARLDAVMGEHESFGEVFDTLFVAVADGDAETVASLARFPLAVATNGEAYEIDGPETFVANYETIVTPAIADVILSQDYPLLFVNQDGVMYGDGEVWLSPVCMDDACERYVWLITAIQE